MMEKLQGSALTAKHASKLKFEPMTEAMAAQAKINPAWAGFMIPYFEPDGTLIPTSTFYRYRFWPDARPSKGWAVVAKGADLRYVQPKDSQLHVYMPPVLALPWVQIMAQPEHDVYITEGELKAACACVNSVPMLGLGGVFSWMSKKHQQEMIPILDYFKWAGRRVFLCFDSDMKDKPLVQLAASRLASALTKRGALVFSVELPSGPDGVKMGVDDFVVAHDIAAFKALAASTLPLKSSKELHQLNEEVALIWEGGAAGNIVRLSDKQIMTARQFTQVLYRDRVYLDMSGGAQATPKPRYAADEWLSWPYRFKVREMTYKPGQSSITEDGYCNTWRPSSLVPAKGDITLWNELLGRMFKNAPASDLLWFRRWLALPLRSPGTKMHTCALIWSMRGGSGKNLLAEIMSPIYGRHNYGEITSKELSSDFNGWAEGKQFIVGDEITLDDKLHASGVLKGMITGDTTSINRKGINAYVVPNCTNFYFASNNPTAILLDEGERRTFVHRAPDGCVDPEFGTLISERIKTGPGAAAVAWHLIHELDMGDFKFNTRPPLTESKQDMIAYSRSDVESWAAALKDRPDDYLPAAAFDRKFVGNATPVYTIYTPKDLMAIYDNPAGSKRISYVALGKALDLAGFIKARYNNARGPGNVRSTYWIIRDNFGGRQLTGTEAAKIYEQERLPGQMQTWKEQKKERTQ